ncbi:MAG: 4-carboxy-4-hydroxy-2-oxoadipate aldolase/oxaloacetate decarboxylase [Actinobacteria bacterium]|nr:4-carboxy-4-hydroxy-2-oxoadipate aldolase/oxaloacetate decarboxylase [Actinomycetota bacterium]
MSAVDRERILAWGSATVHECTDGAYVLPDALRPAWPGAEIVGTAYPVKVAPGDNLALHWALERAEPGDVIVADAHDASHGHWGEVMAAQALAAGLAGLVIWGGVRDTRQQAEMGFPVFSSRITPRGTVKQWAGAHGLPVTIGGVPIAPGDLVVADADGIAIVPAAQVDAVLQRCAQREAKEADIITALSAGETTTLDVYALRELDTPFV